MSADASILASLGLEHLISGGPFVAGSDGTLADPASERVVLATAEMIRGLHLVIDREQAGAWRSVMKACGHACAQKLAAGLDARLGALGQPALAALPLEGCLALLERHFAVQGWGRLRLDLADAADHGLVVAQLENSAFADALPDLDDFADAFPAGVLQGFFEHISGQLLGCEEIACVRRGAAHCTFVIVPPERLAKVMPRLGRESADTILALLRG